MKNVYKDSIGIYYGYCESCRQYYPIFEPLIVPSDFVNDEEGKDRRFESVEEINHYFKLLECSVFIDTLINIAKDRGLIKSYKDALKEIKSLKNVERAELIYESIISNMELMSKELEFKVLLYEDDSEIVIIGKNNAVIHNADTMITKIVKTIFKDLVTNDTIKEIKNVIIGNSDLIHYTKLNPVRYIVVDNGILDLESLELVDSRDFNYYFTNKLNIEINPGFLKALNDDKINESYFENTKWYKALRRFYDDENWEMLKLTLGSILTPHSLKLMVFIIGEHNTGKTTLMELIKKTLHGVATSITLNELDSDRFASKELIGKRVVLSAEKPASKILKSEYFKRLVGGDTVPCRIMHYGYVEIENILKVFSVMNTLPRFAEIDDALAERIVIIYTENELSQNEINWNLRDEIIKDEKEIRKFFEFLIYCAHELKKRNYYIPRNIENTKQLLIEAKNPLTPWIKAKLIPSEESKVEREKAYENYKKWCQENQVEILSRKQFYALMRTQFEETIIHGKYYFKGFELLDERKTENTFT